MLNFYILLNFLSSCYSLSKDDGWNYINLHCRNDNNEPVNWWYLYKPSGEAAPYDDTGRNFTYIISDILDRWIQPNRHITTTNMLQHTLTPIYRITYLNRIAYLIFDDVAGGHNLHAKARGMLIADEVGGIFITHTVPKLADPSIDRPRFPDEELNYGHLLVCISLDVETLNRLGVLIKHTGANIVTLHVPNAMDSIVPAWMDKDTLSRPKPRSVLEFESKQASLTGVMLFRWPGQKTCLYQTFAKSRNIVLDVYAPDGKRKKDVCTGSYGIRTIDSISLKLHDQRVQYLDNQTDRSRFAVSTTAHWQKKGSSRSVQYWTCTSSLDREDRSGKGGFLLCIDDEQVWTAFDNLKVKEPSCK